MVVTLALNREFVPEYFCHPVVCSYLPNCSDFDYFSLHRRIWKGSPATGLGLWHSTIVAAAPAAVCRIGDGLEEEQPRSGPRLAWKWSCRCARTIINTLGNK